MPVAAEQPFRRFLHGRPAASAVVWLKSLYGVDDHKRSWRGTMRTVLFSALAFMTILAGSTTTPALAEDTGLATALHDSARKGNLLCLTEHEHLGSSSAQPSEKAAIAVAITTWRQFTAWEYGSSWARWDIAAGKQIKCSRSPSGFSCDVVARPCKQLARKVRRRR
jgi:hypothetical protein